MFMLCIGGKKQRGWCDKGWWWHAVTVPVQRGVCSELPQCDSHSHDLWQCHVFVLPVRCANPPPPHHHHHTDAGLSSADAGEEVCVCFSNALVRINTLDLRAQVSQAGSRKAGTLGV